MLIFFYCFYFIKAQKELLKHYYPVTQKSQLNMKNPLIEEDLITVIKQASVLLQAKLGHLGSNQFFNPAHISPEVITPNSDAHRSIGGVLARREDLRERLDRYSKEEFPADQIENIFYASKKEEAEYFLIGKIYFKATPRLMGEIDFLRKYVGDVATMEFLLCSYRLNCNGHQYKLIEQARDWEQGLKLVILSVIDFERSPYDFIKERITKWRK